MDLLKQSLDLCKMYDIKPEKSKGQNFLINESIYDKIVDSAEITKNDLILEVGPGLGFLTFKLAQKAKKVLTVEVDSKIAEVLDISLKAKSISNIKIFNQDILKAKGENFSAIGDYKIVSNLPYNISSIFLRKFLSLANKPKLMVLMLQKEVVSRIMAQAPKMSLLAISVQFYAQVEFVLDVSRDNFYPIPKVDSSVIKIIPNKKYLDTYAEEKKFFSLLKIAFSSKRKMLKNNLANGMSLEIKKIENLLDRIGLDKKVRAEELSIGKWLKLYDFLK